MEKFASRKKNSSFTKQIMKKKYVEKSKQQGSDSVTEYFFVFFYFIYALFCIYNKLQLSLRLHLT